MIVMDILKVYQAIIKALNNAVNESDLENLDTYLKDNSKVSIFYQLVRIEYLTLLCMKKYDLGKAKKSINARIKEEKRKERIIFFKRVAVAASFLLIIGFSFYGLYKGKIGNPSTQLIANQIVESGSNKAILTLGNGEEILLEEGSGYKNEWLSSNGEELMYTTQNDLRNGKGNSFNYLTVPRGGQFLLNLSDGTKIWVNSESQLKYPSSFVSGEERVVELIYGEAYFDVSPSENHQGASFTVLTKSQRINVLGTAFNLRAHKNDSTITTTLTEGKVVVESGNAKKFLVPNQQSVINHNSDDITIEEVDASVNSSWVRGLFIFEDKSLYQMTEDLAKWYNIEVFFESKKITDIPFTGILERTKTLNELLEIIEATSGDDFEFELKNRVLLLKEKRKGQDLRQ